MRGATQALIHQCKLLLSYLHFGGSACKFSKTFMSIGACGKGALQKVQLERKHCACSFPPGEGMGRDLNGTATRSCLLPRLLQCNKSSDAFLKKKKRVGFDCLINAQIVFTGLCRPVKPPSVHQVWQ